MALLLPLMVTVAGLAAAVIATNSCAGGNAPAIDQHGYRTAAGRC